MTEASLDDLVSYECTDQIATITFHRPEKLNAFNDELVVALDRRLKQFDADPDANVAILCGEGRAFSSGADVQQRQLRSKEEFEKLGGPQGHGASSHDLLTKSVNWKPVIAAPHGYVLGLINRIAPKGTYLDVARELAAEVNKNPPLSVRATVRARRWYMHRRSEEMLHMSAPLKLYLSEDFQEAARAFAEKRPAGPFKGR